MNKIRDKKNISFLKLAEARTNKIISSLRNLSKLSNRQNYEYSDDEVNQMLSIIKKELNDCENLFKAHKKKSSLFKFKKEDSIN